VWSGVALTGLAVVLFVVSGMMRGRGRKAGSGADGASGPASVPGSAPAGKALKPAKSKAPAVDDDLGDVADILRRHNIH
jgi:hypothetical protein